MSGRRSHQTRVEEGFEMPECWVGCLLPLATVKEPRMMAGPTVGETQHLMTVGETQHLSFGGWWGSRQVTMMERRDFQLGAGVSKEGTQDQGPRLEHRAAKSKLQPASHQAASATAGKAQPCLKRKCCLLRGNTHPLQRLVQLTV